MKLNNLSNHDLSLVALSVFKLRDDWVAILNDPKNHLNPLANDLLPVINKALDQCKSEVSLRNSLGVVR